MKWIKNQSTWQSNSAEIVNTGRTAQYEDTYNVVVKTRQGGTVAASFANLKAAKAWAARKY